MCKCNVQGVICSAKPSEKCHPTQQLLALENFFLSILDSCFVLFFWLAKSIITALNKNYKETICQYVSHELPGLLKHEPTDVNVKV